MERFFYQLSGSTFIFVKNRHQKAANLMFCLILPVAKGPWLFLEVQSIFLAVGSSRITVSVDLVMMIPVV
jgi:hypothetical protein